MASRPTLCKYPIALYRIPSCGDALVRRRRRAYYGRIMVAGMHTLAWIMTYSAALMALVLAAAWNRREPGAYARRLRAVLLHQTVFAAVVTLNYELGALGFYTALDTPWRYLVSISLNSAAYVFLVLFLTLMPEVFRQSPTARRLRSPERELRMVLLPLAILLSAANFAAAFARTSAVGRVSVFVSARGWLIAAVGFVALVALSLGAEIVLPAVYRALAFTPPNITGGMTGPALATVMLLFNIFGEEIWLRGIILPRQELAFGRKARAVNGILIHVVVNGAGIVMLMVR